MNIPITFEQAKCLWPNEVADVMREAAGKPTCRAHKEMQKVEPSQWLWSYSYAISVRGDTSFEAVLRRANKPKPILTLDERVADVVSRVSGSLQCQFKRKFIYRKAMTPKELLESHYRPLYAEEIAEEKRFAALPLPQQQAELNTLLRELKKSTGFVHLHVVVGEDACG